jgi:hypothetical protein
VAATAQQLHEACRDVGFFYVSNTGVPAGVSEGVLRLAHEWFQLPVRGAVLPSQPHCHASIARAPANNRHAPPPPK